MKFPYNDVLTIQQDYKAGKLTREEATQRLSFLLDFDHSNDGCREARDHFPGVHSYNASSSSYGPLLRLSDVCNILRLWASLYVMPQPDEQEYKMREHKQFSEAWQYIDIQIAKSNFLARLFFTEEGVRTEPCPEHKGRWSGCFNNKPGSEGPCLCQSGSNVTGWLALDPKHADRTYWDEEKKRYKTWDELNAEAKAAKVA